MDLTKRELLLEKQLNDLSASAVPKVEKEPVMPVISTPRPAHDMGMTPDELDLRDLAYEARLNTIATNSIVQKLGWKPTKIKSDVTKEMVADYLNEQTKNVNEKGLYIPANLDMDLEPEFVVGDFEEITTRVDKKKRLIEETKAIETALMQVPTLFQEIEDREQRFLEEYTRFLMTVEPVRQFQQATGVLPSPAEVLGYIPQLDRIERSTLIQYVNGLGQFEADRDRLRDEIELAQKKIAENEFEVDRIDARVRQLREEQDAGRAEKAVIDQRNAQRKRAYADQIRLLNSGRMIPEQLPGETPEEYKQRLVDVGTTTPDPNSVDSAAKLFYTDVLREKLQEILSDEGDISTFIKDMDGDQRYLVVKNFPTFKTKFQDVMGKDKVRASGGTMKLLLELKDNLVGTLAQKKVDETKQAVEEAMDLLSFVPPDTDALASIRAEIEANRGTLTRGQKDNLIAFIDNPDHPEYSRKGGVAPQEFKKAAYDGFRTRIQKVHDSTKVAPALRTLTRQSTEELKASKPAPTTLTDQETYRRLRDGILARLDEIERLDPQRQDAGLQGEDEALRQLLQAKNLQQLGDAARLVQIDLQQFAKPSGKGIGRKHAEKVAFGRVDIHPNRLFYDNILRITKSGRELTGFPQRKVSDAFVDVVFTVLKGQTPTLRAFKKMGEEERKLYDTLVFMSGLSKEVEHTGSGVKEDLKKRLQLIEGEIEAGNTNPLLIKEARQVLHHMAQMKMVARPKAVAHLKQLQAFQCS